MAWKDAEEFISKFPPIMRVNQGDNVLVCFDYNIFTVIDMDWPRGKIYLQDIYGEAHSCNADEIDKWPWELEQKGGTEQ